MTPRSIAVLAAAVLATPARAAEPVQTALFTAGEGGYHTYRIPALIVGPKGSVLAFCEGRKAGRGDAGDIDLVLKRSVDGGKTWGEMQVVWDDGPNTCGNPCPVVDARTGTIWLLLTHNLGKDTEKLLVSGKSTGTRTVWIGGVVGPNCNECQAVELSDGSVMLNMRTYRGTNRRLVAISKDGGETFSKPIEDETLIEPVCQASILRLPARERNEKPALLFSNPASTKREKLTIRLSLDDGKTWPHAKELHPGPAAYSCLTVLPNGEIACLYERGAKNPYETIMLARFTRGWVEGK
jgi:Neuraminidase (sialidase)